LIATRAGLRVWVATQPIDFRRGVHGLVALVAQALCADPYGGEIFVFRSKRNDRIKLLEAIRAVIQEWTDSMDRSIQAIRDDWEGRLRDVATRIIRDVRDMVELRERETIQHPGDEERAAKEAKERAMNTVRNGERKFRKYAREIFHHSEERWVMDDLLGQDLFSEEVWRMLGLTRGQLAFAAACLGGVIEISSRTSSCGAASKSFTSSGRGR